MPLVERLKFRFTKNYDAVPDVIAAAPGRVEFIGNHTDYNNGPVIGAAIDRYVFVALRRIEESVFRFSSGDSSYVAVEDPTQKLKGKRSWINYPLGVYDSLIRRGLKPSGGFELVVDSDVPMGAGLSSSAALELAVCQALCTVYGLGLSREEMALASREAENEFVGMPCGILDQGVSAMGTSGSLVYIDCRDMRFSTIPLGKNYSIWIFNTHKKHSLVESMYSERHNECFQAVDGLNGVGLRIQYLADISPADFQSAKSRLLGTLSNRAEHIVSEIERVNRVKHLLEGGRVSEAGQLLFESHASSRDLFENSVEELDYLVEILKSLPNVIGARLTGGGFGGAVMALTEDAFSPDYAESVASAYRGRFGQPPEVIQCRLSDGVRVVERIESTDTIEPALG
ncbi:galactokinase [Candidatus Pelagisphaera phototrophica]|uniref:galactokinase n=1 Tax=Candidatus Pelagisphaera phototrophica TaxID=2684113 RepID=UPI0019ED281D|nr:galactokinase [Candidatus Pelagisphaera phototrophica]QXD32686.1 galactokinase [Candidatus Pelagisphaera phototrophica]